MEPLTGGRVSRLRIAWRVPTTVGEGDGYRLQGAHVLIASDFHHQMGETIGRVMLPVIRHRPALSIPG